jgi:adiponectin receptor
VLLPLHLVSTTFPSLAPFLPHPTTWWGASDPTPVPPTTHDKVALTVYLVCAVACMGLSSYFHTVQACSRDVCDSAHRGDYVSRSRARADQLGIVILIVGSILPGMYYAFDQAALRYFYMGA